MIRGSIFLVASLLAVGALSQVQCKWSWRGNETACMSPLEKEMSLVGLRCHRIMSFFNDTQVMSDACRLHGCFFRGRDARFPCVSSHTEEFLKSEHGKADERCANFETLDSCVSLEARDCTWLENSGLPYNCVSQQTYMDIWRCGAIDEKRLCERYTTPNIDGRPTQPSEENDNLLQFQRTRAPAAKPYDAEEAIALSLFPTWSPTLAPVKIGEEEPEIEPELFIPGDEDLEPEIERIGEEHTDPIGDEEDTPKPKPYDAEEAIRNSLFPTWSPTLAPVENPPAETRAPTSHEGKPYDAEEAIRNSRFPTWSPTLKPVESIPAPTSRPTTYIAPRPWSYDLTSFRNFRTFCEGLNTIQEECRYCDHGVPKKCKDFGCVSSKEVKTGCAAPKKAKKIKCKKIKDLFVCQRMGCYQNRGKCGGRAAMHV